jgi:hypothetical protein
VGRQFSYYACPEDLAEIEGQVFKPLGGRLMIAEKRNGQDHLVPAESFSLSVDRMGQETLFLLLNPPAPLERLVFSGPWLSTTDSHLVEVGRSYIKDGQIRAARFWHEVRLLDGDRFIEKPTGFTEWAADVYVRTKRLLSRHTVQKGKFEYTEWYGKVAKREVEDGRLELS